MTDPVVKIEGVKETGGKTTQSKVSKEEKRKHHSEESADDSVDISDEARDRASGKKRANILEYINNSGR